MTSYKNKITLAVSRCNARPQYCIANPLEIWLMSGSKCYFCSIILWNRSSSCRLTAVQSFSEKNKFSIRNRLNNGRERQRDYVVSYEFESLHVLPFYGSFFFNVFINPQVVISFTWISKNSPEWLFEDSFWKLFLFLSISIQTERLSIISPSLVSIMLPRNNQENNIVLWIVTEMFRMKSSISMNCFFPIFSIIL